MDNIDNINIDKKPLPNADLILVFGICSIIGCLCYGIVGLGLGITALVLGNKAKKLFDENPEKWTNYSNVNAGRICAIIGIIMSGIFILFWIIYIIFFASMIFAAAQDSVF